jgi:hypothetical protein
MSDMGCVADGETREEALTNTKETMAEWLAAARVAADGVHLGQVCAVGLVGIARALDGCI